MHIEVWHLLLSVMYMKISKKYGKTTIKRATPSNTCLHNLCFLSKRCLLTYECCYLQQKNYILLVRTFQLKSMIFDKYLSCQKIISKCVSNYKETASILRTRRNESTVTTCYVLSNRTNSSGVGFYRE